MVKFGRFPKLSERVSRTAVGFSALKCFKQNVNLPGYTFAPAALIPLYRPQTSNKLLKINTLHADSSHFPGVNLKCINEAITKRK